MITLSDAAGSPADLAASDPPWMRWVPDEPVPPTLYCLACGSQGDTEVELRDVDGFAYCHDGTNQSCYRKETAA